MTACTVQGAGAPDRASRPRLHRPGARSPDHADAAPDPRPHRRTPDRLGQCVAAGALHAAVQPDGAVRRRCSPGVRTATARAGRVLGARGRVHAGRAVAVDAAPDAQVREPRPRMDGPAAQSRAGRIADGGDREPTAPRRRATSTTACPGTRRTGAGTGRRPRRPWSICSSPASWPSPAGTRPSSGCTTCPSG